MALNVNGLNIANTFAQSGLISGKELEKVSSELFSQASKVGQLEATKPQVKINVPAFSKDFDPGINFFNKNADLNTVNQIAVAKKQDVNISQSALNNIQALKTEAAKAQTSTIIHKNVDGKLHIETRADVAGDLKSVFELSSATPNIFKSNSLDKDKRGSGSLFSGHNGEQHKEEKKESKIKELNLVA